MLPAQIGREGDSSHNLTPPSPLPQGSRGSLERPSSPSYEKVVMPSSPTTCNTPSTSELTPVSGRSSSPHGQILLNTPLSGIFGHPGDVGISKKKLSYSSTSEVNSAPLIRRAKSIQPVTPTPRSARTGKSGTKIISTTLSRRCRGKQPRRSTKRSTPTTGYRVGMKISRERRRRETSSGGKGIGKRQRRKPGQQPQCTKNSGTVRITRPNKRRRNGSGSTGTIQPTYEKKACIPGISTPRASSDYWTSPPKPYGLGQQVSHPKNVESLVLHLLQPIKEAALKQVQALEVVEKDVVLPDQAAAETPQTRARASVLETHRAAQALIARAKTALLISPEDLSERQVIFFIYYYFRKRKNHRYQLQPCKQISRASEGIPTQFLRHYLPTNQCAYGRCHKFLSL